MYIKKYIYHKACYLVRLAQGNLVKQKLRFSVEGWITHTATDTANQRKPLKENLELYFLYGKLLWPNECFDIYKVDIFWVIKLEREREEKKRSYS